MAPFALLRRRARIWTSPAIAGLVLFAGKRLLIAVPVLIAVVVADFSLIHLAPGNPVTALIGDYPAAPSLVQHIKEEYGLNEPLPVQLWRYLIQLAHGNLATSYTQHQAVLSLLIGRLGATLTLMGSALALAVVAGTVLGAVAAHWRGSLLDTLIQGFALLGFSIPEFWLGELLILCFAVRLGSLPISGDAPLIGGTGLLSDVPYIVLPALALSMRYIALIARMTRTSLIEVSGADFITAARSRGMSEASIFREHAYRNAAPPVVQIIGFNLGYLVAGSVMIETVFAWPGIGQLLYQSIGNRDYPVMTGILLTVSVSVVVVNILTDIVHKLLDPREASR